MLSIVLALLIDLFFLAGLGLLCQRLALGRGGIALNDAIIPGSAVLALVGVVANFFLPLAQVVSLAVAISALAGFILAWRSQAHGDNCPTPNTERRTRAGLIAAFFSLLTSLVTLKIAQTTPHADTGLYHLPAIIWGMFEPLPFGLAALHHRFGLNSVWHMASATVAVPGTGLSTAYALNGALGLGILTFFAWRGLLGINNRSLSVSAAAALLFGISVSTLNYQLFNSPNTDLPAALFTFTAFYYALSLCENNTPVVRKRLLFNLCTSAALATSIKLSQLPILLLPLWFLWRSRELGLKSCGTWRLGISLLMAWAARGVWLSGCLLFPVAATCFGDLPWALPASIADNITLWIRSFARTPGADPAIVMANSDWLLPWLSRNNRWELILLVAFLIFGIALQAWACIRKKPFSAYQADLLAVWLTSLAGLTIWFVQAPDIRFGYGFLVSAAVLSLVAGFARLGLWPGPNSLSAIHHYLLVAVFAIPLILGIAKNARTTELPIIAPWPIVPQPVLQANRTHSSEVVFDVPAGPAGSGMCWAQRGFCTPMFDPNFHTNHLFGRLWMRTDAPAAQSN